ncbi:MAG: OmpA family protein [Desulfomonilaceae bacterium]
MDSRAKLIALGLVLAAALTTLTAVVAASDCEKAGAVYQQTLRSALPLEKKLELLRSIIQACPQHVEARALLAEMLIKSPDFEKASLVEKNRMLDEAASHFEKAAQYDNKNVSVYWRLAKVYYSQGRNEKAAECYQRILELNPSDIDAKRALKKLRASTPQQPGHVKTAEDIKKDYEAASHKNEIRLMGIANFTAPKHRERFNNITFDEWKYDIKKENEQQLSEIGRALQDLQGKGLTFFIEGHTDNRGDRDRNQVLSENRAKATKEYLVKKFNVNPSKIQTQGFGFDRPLLPNDSPEHMAKNRRVEVLFIEPSGNRP